MKIFCINIDLPISNNKIYQVVDKVEEADCIFLNYKIRSKQHKIKLVTETNVPVVTEALNLSRQFQKKLVYMCGGDVPPVILPNCLDIRVLNTSVYKSIKCKNEIVIAPHVEDNFSFFLTETKLSIGFVGHKLCNRHIYLDYLSKSSIETNFIIRDAYIHKLKKCHKRDFENNMNNNLFTFCYRGGGNFSVRFYETLMRGRIPIVVTTDNVFPYEDKINYSQIGLFIEEESLRKEMNLESLILDYYNQKSEQDLIEIQKYNRYVYETYFRKDIFYEKLFEYLLESNIFN